MVFKIGDHVKYINTMYGDLYELLGIIRSVLNEDCIKTTQYLVEFEGWNKGHTGNGLKLTNNFKTNVPNCWYCRDEDITLISSKPDNFEFELGHKEMEELKMDLETIKTFNKNNLKAGKELAEKEKADYETQQAKNYYTALINRKQEVDRIIAEYKKELENISEKLSLYK